MKNIALCLGLFGLLGLGAAHASPTLNKLREVGILTIGYREASIPFSYLDEKGRPVGYMLDICNRIAEALKEKLALPHLETKMVLVTPATRIPLLMNGVVDLDCGSTTNTVERQKQVSFLLTTFVTSVRILSRKDRPIKMLRDAPGERIVSSAGTTGLRLLVDVNRSEQLQMQVLVARDHAEAFHMVASGRAAGFVMDEILLRGLVATSPNPGDFVISDEPLSIEPYAIGIRRNDGEFKRLADETLIEMFRNGEIQSIYRRWFESPIPPRRINLQQPMNSALQRLFRQPTDSPNRADYE